MAYISQLDPRWVNLRLGNSPYTIGVSGCTVTDLAMYIGTTPDVVVQRLMAVGGLTQDGLVIWAKIAEAFPGVYVEEPYFRAYNNDEVLNNLPCLVEVDYDGNPRTVGNHWVLYIGNQQLIDPLDGQVKPTNAYPAVLSYRAIKGAWQQVKPQPTQDHYFVDETGKYKVDYNNLDSLKVTFDTWVRLEKGELVDKHQYQQQADAASSCQTQLSIALEQNERNQAQITALQEELNKVKLDYNENEREIINLKGQLEKVHSEDKDYAQKAYDSEKLAEGRKDLVDALADKLHIDPSITDEKQKVEECLKAVELLAKEKGDEALTHYQHLSNIVTDLIENGGLNNFLKENGLGSIDLAKLHDPQLAEKVKTWLNEVYNELQSVEDEVTANTTPSPVLITNTKPTGNFFSRTFLLPVRFVTNLLFTQSQS